MVNCILVLLFSQTAPNWLYYSLVHIRQNLKQIKRMHKINNLICWQFTYHTLYMYINIYTYMYICLYVYIYIYIDVHIHTHVYYNLKWQKFTQHTLYMYVYMHISLSLYIYVYILALSAGTIEYTNCISAEELELPLMSVLDKTLNHLMVRFQLCSFGECGVLLYWYYS